MTASGPEGDPPRDDEPRWPRPVPRIGDRTSAAERRADPGGWAFSDDARAAIYDVVRARRDIRRFRPDPVDPALLERVLGAAHTAPSVGQSQPWRFVVVADPATRERAASMADRCRLEQAAGLSAEAGRHLLDLELEGIRQAPLGIVVCCDRRVPAAGVLGRATFADADLWSCACAIENLWLAARAEGLGAGWVTLFEPPELAALIGLPEGVETLGWLCLGWPDERPPEPGLERAGWSSRLPLADVVVHDRWPADGEPGPAPPPSRLAAPAPDEVVAARDRADELLTPPGSLGVLDRAVDRVVALGRGEVTAGTLVLVAARHRVAELGVSAFEASVGDDVLAAARAGRSIGTAAAAAAGLATVVEDAGTSTGNLRDRDALAPDAVQALVERGRVIGRRAGAEGLVALGEVGIGNTTVAAALAAWLLGLDPAAVVGRGAGADAAMLARKEAVVAAALARAEVGPPGPAADPAAGALAVLGTLGGPDVALLAGVALGAAEVGAPIVLDGLLTSVAAAVAVRAEPAVAAHLVAGQRSREPVHQAVLVSLGLEPLLDLRFRAGEGVGASLACGVLLDALELRRTTGRTT